MPYINDNNRRWWILYAMSAIGGLIMLDETVVGIALPTIRQDLSLSETTLHWVINAYFLVFTVTAAASGKLGDIIGFKKLLIAGLTIFGLSSLASGFAENGGFIISARAVQGVGAAVIFPASVAMVTLVFPKEQRGMAIGFLTAIGTTFLAIGPLVGGFLTEVFSWRWIFWVNVPIVLLTALIILAAWTEPPSKPGTSKFDYGGLLTLVVGLGLLVFAIMQGAGWGWTQGVILSCFSGGFVVLILFILIEGRSDNPLIETALFRVSTFSACTLVLFVGQFSKIVCHMSITLSGLATIMMAG